MMRVNHWPDPWFRTAKPDNVYGCTVTHGNGQVYIAANADTCCCGWDIDGLDKNTDMVFRVFAWDGKPTSRKLFQIYRMSGSSIVGNPIATQMAGKQQDTYTVRFNTGSYAKVRIEFYPVNGYNVNLEYPQLERADTYDAAVGGGYPSFFAYDTMPAPRSV